MFSCRDGGCSASGGGDYTSYRISGTTIVLITKFNSANCDSSQTAWEQVIAENDFDSISHSPKMMKLVMRSNIDFYMQPTPELLFVDGTLMHEVRVPVMYEPGMAKHVRFKAGIVEFQSEECSLSLGLCRLQVQIRGQVGYSLSD